MQYHGTIPWATTNHVPKPCARPNHLWLDLKSRLTLTIPPLNLTWSNHQLPSSIYRGLLHTPPYHLGLSPDFTSELPGVCMPYQVLQLYSHLHENYSINFFSFLSSWWLHHHHPFLHPLAFPCFHSCLISTMLFLYLHLTLSLTSI